MPTSIIFKLHNYFSTKSPALQYTSANAAIIFEIRPLEKWCFVFETISSMPTSPLQSPFAASYCTHINTLITINGLHSSVNFSWRNFFRD